MPRPWLCTRSATWSSPKRARRCIALGKTTGVTQAGIVNALANRQYQEAKPDLLKLLGSADAVVRPGSGPRRWENSAERTPRTALQKPCVLRPLPSWL